MSSKWSNLYLWQLKELAVLASAAESQAMYKYSRCTELLYRSQWANRIRDLAHLQDDIRALAEEQKMKPGVEYVT